MLKDTFSQHLRSTFLCAGDDHITFDRCRSASQQLFRQFSDACKPAPGSRIAVLAEDPLLAIVMVHAVISGNCTPIPVPPGYTEQQINQLFDMLDPAFCIVETHLAYKCSAAHKLYCVDSLPETAEENDTSGRTKWSDLPLMLCHAATDGSLRRKEISADLLEKIFHQYDELYEVKPSDVLLIFEEELYTRIPEVLWAWYNGITVVLHASADKSPMDQWVPTAVSFGMQFGLFYFGSHNEGVAERNKYKLLIDSVKFADEHDFSCVWTPERHFNQFGGLFPNPSVLSAALAMVTSRIQLRSGSIVSPLHHAVRIAEDWSVVDNLSNGRAAVSFASGWQCNDFVFFPDRYDKRHEYMLEQIAEVKSFWKGEHRAMLNGLKTPVEIEIFPKPVQAELPVWMTVSGKTESFVDAGKIGANILTHLLWQDTDELIGKIRAYRDSLEMNGFDPASRIVSVMAHTFLGADNDAVKEKVKPFLMDYIRSSVHLIEAMSGSNVQNREKKDVVGRYGTVEEEMPAELLEQLVEFAFERFFEKAALLGTPEKTHHLIRKLKGYGVDEIACLIDFGLPDKEILAALPYLNELRKLYDTTLIRKYNVTLMRCSGEKLASLKSNNDAALFLSRLRKILTDSSHDALSADQEYDHRQHILRFNEHDVNSLFDVIDVAIPEMKEADVLEDFNAPIDKSF